jgi:hypothetical protein
MSGKRENGGQRTAAVRLFRGSALKLNFSRARCETLEAYNGLIALI